MQAGLADEEEAWLTQTLGHLGGGSGQPSRGPALGPGGLYQQLQAQLCRGARFSVDAFVAGQAAGWEGLPLCCCSAVTASLLQPRERVTG